MNDFRKFYYNTVQAVPFWAVLKAIQPRTVEAPSAAPGVLEQLEKVATARCCSCCKAFESNGQQLLNCSRCRHELYYSRACQKRAWKGHKKNCTIPCLAGVFNFLPEDVVFRVIGFSSQVERVGVSAVYALWKAAVHNFPTFELDPDLTGVNFNGGLEHASDALD